MLRIPSVFGLFNVTDNDGPRIQFSDKQLDKKRATCTVGIFTRGFMLPNFTC